MVFTTLAHHLDEELLREAYRQTRKNSSPGIDGVTAKQYEENLEENLRDIYADLSSDAIPYVHRVGELRVA